METRGYAILSVYMSKISIPSCFCAFLKRFVELVVYVVPFYQAVFHPIGNERLRDKYIDMVHMEFI